MATAAGRHRQPGGGEKVRGALEGGTGVTFNQIVHFALTAIVAGIGAYLGTYLKAKAERRVIREGFEEILQQLDKTTRLTEQIKTQVSGKFWLAQEKWKLRRDLYLALLHNIESASRVAGEAQGGIMPASELTSRLLNYRAEISKAMAAANLVSDEAVRLIEHTLPAGDTIASIQRLTDEVGRWKALPEAEMLSRRHAAEVELARLFGKLKAVLDELYRGLAKAGRSDLELDVPDLEG
jgi:hypothetical protein